MENIEKEKYSITTDIFSEMNYEDWLSLAMYSTPLDILEFFGGDAEDDLIDDSLEPIQHLIAKTFSQGEWVDYDGYKNTVIELAQKYVNEIDLVGQLQKAGLKSLESITIKYIDSPRYYNYQNDAGIWDMVFTDREALVKDLFEISEVNNFNMQAQKVFVCDTEEGFDQYVIDLENGKVDDSHINEMVYEIVDEQYENAYENAVDEGKLDYGYGHIDGFIGYLVSAKYGDVNGISFRYDIFVNVPEHIASLSEENLKKVVETKIPLWKKPWENEGFFE